MNEKLLPLLAPRDTRWVDGLRGIAAVFVVSSHLTIGYAEWLTTPSRGEHSELAFYNYPFIRVFAEGFPWVAIFLVLTGFVNALKPIKQARAGRAESALSGLASSCFRRTSRLVLPATLITTLSWLICESGGYEIGTLVESNWMNGTSPSPSGSVSLAVSELGRAIWDTWANYNNHLDRNQWTMLWFLKGSLALYVTLLAVVRATPKCRMFIFAALFLYGWRNGDTMVFMPIYSGALLAELSMNAKIIKFATNQSLITRLMPFSMLLLGWYIMSYPKFYPEWQPWSNKLWHIAITAFPQGAEAHSYWNIIGVILITSAIILSNKLQKYLCNPILLWLGARSFPIYLIHGPLLRSFLNWMLYAFVPPIWHEEVDEEGVRIRLFARHPIQPAWKFLITVPIFYVVLLHLAHLWTQKVEPRCADVTEWLEDVMCAVVVVRDEFVYEQVSQREDDGGDGMMSASREEGATTLLPT